jgi:hypothetical protein
MVRERSRKISNAAMCCGSGRCGNQQLLPAASHPVFFTAISNGLLQPPHIGWLVGKTIWMREEK